MPTLIKVLSLLVQFQSNDNLTLFAIGYSFLSALLQCTDTHGSESEAMYILQLMWFLTLNISTIYFYVITPRIFMLLI